MSKEGLQKELDYLLLAKNNIWTLFIATSGGTLGLLFLPNSPLKFILLPAGFILAIALLDAYFKKDDKIEAIIKQLKRGD